METAFQIIVSVFISWLTMLATEPKKQRILEYNELLQKLLDKLAESDQTAIQYWTQEGALLDLERQIISFKTECYRLATTLHRKGCKFYDVEVVTKSIASYFKIVTGGEFQQADKNPAPNIFDETNIVMNNLKNQIEQSKVSCTVNNILFTKIS